MKKNNLFWGILLILTALFIIADSMGYLQNVGIMKILFGVLFAGVAIKGLLKMNFQMILFPIAFICIMFADKLGIENLTPWPMLIIALLISTGLSLIFHKHPHYHYHNSNNNFENRETFINNKDNSEIQCYASFGSVTKYINTNDFKSCYIESNFGACKVYFDNAVITGNSAQINVNCSFSGVELYIPRNWRVVQQVNPFLGGVDEKNEDRCANGPVVNLCGNVSFSGITIIYI